MYTAPGRISRPEADNDTTYLLLNTGLTIIDFSNPSSPAPRGSMVLSQEITSTQAVGDLAFSVAQRSGLHIFDTIDPVRPVLHAVYRDSDTTSAEELSNVVVQGSFAYLATEATLKIIDVSNPSNPALRGEYKGLDGFARIRVSDNRLYLSGHNKLYIFDISDPSRPTLLAAPPVSADSIVDLSVAGNTVYMVTGNCGFACFGHFQIVDVSDPASPAILARLGVNAIGKLSVAGPFVYMASPDVQIIDVSDPAEPALRNT